MTEVTYLFKRQHVSFHHLRTFSEARSSPPPRLPPALDVALSPADFGKLIADETEKWGKVVKFTGIKAD